jgi:hypothetical protein
MTDESKEIVLFVREASGGWVIIDGVTNGPFYSKALAVDLAEGMAVAIRASGQRARVVVN